MRDRNKRTDGALAAVEASGRLAVHAWAALEQGHVDEAMRLLGAISSLTAGTIEQVEMTPERAAAIYAAARDLVNPVIGWPQDSLPAREEVALHA